MFCCVPDTLYYTMIQLGPYNLFLSTEIQSLKQKLKNQQNQSLLPPVMQLLCEEQLQSSQQEMLFQGLPQYRLSFSQQILEFTIQQLVPNPQQNMWKVLLKNQQQSLEEGELFSFDQYQFRIYKLQKTQHQIFDQQECPTNDKCRICLSELTSKANPLLNLCNCTGTIKYMHLDCCRQWIKDGLKVQKRNKHTTYQFTKSSCNICKEKWKKVVKYQKQNYYLFDFQHQPIESRISNLSSISNRSNKVQNRQANNMLLMIDDFYISDDDQQTIQGLYIIKINMSQIIQKQNKSFTIGKQPTCDISLDELYLQSDHQCQIRIQKNKLIIKDSDSQNGTNVCINNLKNLNFNTKKGILLKFDRTVFKIKGKHSFLACLQPEITYNVIFQSYSQTL